MNDDPILALVTRAWLVPTAAAAGDRAGRDPRQGALANLLVLAPRARFLCTLCAGRGTFRLRSGKAKTFFGSGRCALKFSHAGRAGGPLAIRSGFIEVIALAGVLSLCSKIVQMRFGEGRVLAWR
jgi:hypothetical protein